MPDDRRLLWAGLILLFRARPTMTFTPVAVRHHFLRGARPWLLARSHTLCGRRVTVSALASTPSVEVDDSEAQADTGYAADGPEALDLDHLRGSKHLHPYWLKRLAILQRPSARALVSQITPVNALGFDAGPSLITRKGTLFDYVLSQKKAHPDKVVLTRVGEFYETYGVDALMMIEHAGLNPMGNKAKAGCPVRNIQATLDGLTSAGLTVAVCEEVNELDTLSARTRIKARMLAQVVSPGASTYLFDCCLRPDDVEFKDNRPYVGLLKSAQGFSLVEVFVDEKVARVTERMTGEAVRTALQAGGLAEPLYVQGLDAELLRALLPSRDLESRDLSGYTSDVFHTAVLRSLSRDLESDLSDVRVIRSPSEARPRPIYLSTAQQIGVLSNPNVPDLVRCLLPPQHAAHSARFLRRWLLTPPPFTLADRMAELCRGLAHVRTGLPQCRPMPVGKLVSMLSLRQGNAPLFRDVHSCLTALVAVLDSPKDGGLGGLVPCLLELVAYESGLEIERGLLRERTGAAIEAIEDVVSPQTGSWGCGGSAGGKGSPAGNGDTLDGDAPFSDGDEGRIPQVFFERNEEVFRGCVRPKHPFAAEAYDAVTDAAKALCAAVRDDFPPECEIVVDQFNNAIMLKRKPQSRDPALYIAPTDRNRKPIAKRYTTARVEGAISDYLAAVDRAVAAVKKALQDLSEILRKDSPALVTSLHVAVVLQAAAAHVAAARQKGWSLPKMVGEREGWAMRINGLVPYWMDRGSGVANDVELAGLFLLTAPNMSGKSTLMRSMAVAALLANCGLHVPAAAAQVPRFDNIFMRTASYDVPAEGKSAFALEMDDVRVMLRDCSSRSFVLLDEIGKGTSARDGAALGGALLEALDKVPVTGVFATHLHEMFDLPLDVHHVSYKRMGSTIKPDGKIIWTYQLEDGRCLDSMALYTARAYGIPEKILSRAAELGMAFDTVCRGNGELLGEVSNGGGQDKEDDNGATKVVKQPKRGVRRGRVSASASSTLNQTVETEDVMLQHMEAPKEHTLQDAMRVMMAIGNLYRGVSVDAIESMSSDAGVGMAGYVVDGRGVGAPFRPVVVAAGFDAPPALEGYACVYVLRITNRAEGDVFYVGETESVRKRLAQHRTRHGADVEAAMMSVRSKSEGRGVEAAVIREMRRSGFPLLSDKDAHRHVAL